MLLSSEAPDGTLQAATFTDFIMKDPARRYAKGFPPTSLR